MAVILDLNNTGTIPQSFASGSWPITAFNTGKWRFTWTPTLASTNASWRPTGSTFGFWCMFGGLTEPNGSGIWIEYVVSTQVHSIVLVRTSDGNVITGARRAFTWNANQPVTFIGDLSSATAGASTIDVSGAASGNGSSSGFTRETILAADTLQWGRWGGSGTYQLLASTVSDVDDTAAASVSRSATFSIAIDSATSASRALVRAAAMTVALGASTDAATAHVRAAAMSVAVGASTAAGVSPGSGTSRTVTMAVAADASTAAARDVVRLSSMAVVMGASTDATVNRQRSASMTFAVAASTAATVAGAVSFGPGVSTSGLWPFGRSAAVCTIPGGYLPPGGGGADADGRTPPASITTETSGSAFYVAVARPVATADKTFTDNKGNTYTSLAIGDYGGASAWESQVALALNGTGGAAHTLTANSVLNDETTLAFSEIKKCAYLADFATAFTANGSTQISPAGVDLKGPGWVYVDWFGDGAVTGAEGAIWTVTAVDEGPTVGSQWQVVDSRIVNHNDGWIQWKRWRRYYATATTGIRLQLATLSVPQGARWYTAALMEANITLASATMVIAVGAVTAAARVLARALGMSVAVGASVSGAGSRARISSMPIVVGSETSAVLNRSRVTSMAVAVGAATDAAMARTRSASLSVAVGAATLATPRRSRSLSMAVDVEVSTSASAVAGGGAQRSATMQVAVGATATAALRAFRASSMHVPVGAFASATVPGQTPPTRLLPARVSISVVGVEPFRMEIE